jgi:hypothetical protein
VSGGYVTYDQSEVGELRSQLRDIRDRLSELEAPTGSQTADTLATLKMLVEDLVDTVNSLAASGVTWAGPVSTGGNVDAANVTGSGNVTGGSVFAQSVNTNITATRVAVWGRTSDGFLGTATSSEKRKANITPLDIDPEAVLSIEPVYYQWIEQLEERERRANLPVDHPEYVEDMHVSTEVGMIAERLHEAGLWQFVVYARNPDDTLLLDEHGDAIPDGIHYVNWGVALQVVARHLASEMVTMKGDIAELKAALGITA